MSKKKFLPLNLAFASMTIVAASISCSSKINHHSKQKKETISSKEKAKVKLQNLFISKMTLEEMQEHFGNLKIGQKIKLADLKIALPEFGSTIKVKTTLAEKFSTTSKFLKVFLTLEISEQIIEQVIKISPANSALVEEVSKQKKQINKNNELKNQDKDEKKMDEGLTIRKSENKKSVKNKNIREDLGNNNNQVGARKQKLAIIDQINSSKIPKEQVVDQKNIDKSLIIQKTESKKPLKNKVIDNNLENKINHQLGKTKPKSVIIDQKNKSEKPNDQAGSKKTIDKNLPIDKSESKKSLKIIDDNLASNINNQVSRKIRKPMTIDQANLENIAARFAKAIDRLSHNQVIVFPYERGMKNLLEQKWKIANKIRLARKKTAQWQLDWIPKNYDGNQKIFTKTFDLPSLNWRNFSGYRVNFYFKLKYVELNSNYQSGGYRIEYIFKKDKTISQKRSFFIKYQPSQAELSYLVNKKIVEKQALKLKAAIKARNPNKTLLSWGDEREASLATRHQKTMKKIKSVFSQISATERKQIRVDYFANAKAFTIIFKSLKLDLADLAKNKVQFLWNYKWVPLSRNKQSGGYQIEYILKKGVATSKQETFFIKYISTAQELAIAYQQGAVEDLALRFEHSLKKLNKNNLTINLSLPKKAGNYLNQISKLANSFKEITTYQKEKLNNNLLMADDFMVKRFASLFPSLPINISEFANRNVKFVFTGTIDDKSAQNPNVLDWKVKIQYQFVKDQKVISQPRFFFIKYRWGDSPNERLANFKAFRFGREIENSNTNKTINLPLSQGVKNLNEQKIKIAQIIKSRLQKNTHQEAQAIPKGYVANRKMFFACFTSLNFNWDPFSMKSVKFYWRPIWVPLNQENDNNLSGGYKIEYVFKKANQVSRKQSFFIKYILNEK